MSLHQSIKHDMQRIIDDMGDCAAISPTTVALHAQEKYETPGIDPHIEYASLEHLKNMARKLLARRYTDRGKDNRAYDRQGEFFSGNLQDRYPVPRKKGEDHVYKLKEHLTQDEAAWNMRMLRRTAHARLAHADAFEAWYQTYIAGEQA